MANYANFNQLLGLKDRVAIVTGASKGIGLAIAQTLAAWDAKVLLVARDKTMLESAVERLRPQNQDIHYFVADVSSPNSAKDVIAEAIRLWGRVDILVNNAGGPPPGGFLEHSDENWESAIQTNLLSVIRFSREAAKHMKKNSWGRIVSITSTVAKEPSPQMVLSTTARAGVSTFSKAISVELADSNITVNVICPGGVSTDRLRDLVRKRSELEGRPYDEVLSQSEAAIPMKRFANPDEIAKAVLFLASDMGSYVTGVSLNVDGGLTKGFT